MQREEKEKPKVRLKRNMDGSIGLPQSDGASSSDKLDSAWGKPKKPKTVKPVGVSIHEKIKQIQNDDNQDATKNTPVVKKRKKTKLKKPTSTTLHLSKVSDRVKDQPKKYAIIGAAVVSVVFIFGIVTLWPDSSNNSNGEVKGATANEIKTKVTPEFPVLSPLGAGVDALGGFAKISPEGSASVYAFRDTIGSVVIRVSQQQLPDNLRTDQASKLEELATNFNAKKRPVI